MDHEQTQGEAAAYLTVLASGTDAKYKFKQASKFPPACESPNTTSYWNWSHFTFPVNWSLEKKQHFKQKKETV